MTSGFAFAETRKVSAAITQTEFEQKTDLERNFRDKIRTALPNVRFSLDVEFIPYARVALSILGSEAGVRESTEATLNRVKTVHFYSDRSLPPETVALILGIPRKKIQLRTAPFAKLESEPTAVTASTTEPEDKKVDAPNSDSSAAMATAPTPIVENTSNFQHFVDSNFKIILLFLLSTLAFVGLVISRSMGWIRNSITGLGKTLAETGIKTTGSDLGPNPVSDPRREPDSGRREVSARNFGGENEPSELQILAYFSECYWAGEDESASGLVRRFPRAELYQKLSFGAEYIDYLRNVDPGSFDLMVDSYFVSPRPEYYELSVHDTPKAALRLASEMRIRASRVPSVELLQIQELRTAVIFSGLKSAHRDLPTIYRVELKSVDEERSLLTTNELSEEIKRRLPSLFRLTFLTPEDQTRIFDEMTAYEIAEAWIGPEEVLASLLPQIPLRKRELLRDLNGKISATRDSASFRRLLRRTDAVLSSAPPAGDRMAA
jgi:hypothetical protein